MIVLLKVLVNNTVKCIGSPKTRNLLFCAFKTNLCDVNEKKNMGDKHEFVKQTHTSKPDIPYYINNKISELFCEYACSCHRSTATPYALLCMKYIQLARHLIYY